jgi:hypothetical protein
LMRHWGAATVADVAAEVAGGKSGLSNYKLIASVLGAQENFHWLDRSAGWFWLSDGSRNPLLHSVMKILSVANPIGAEEMRTGILRYYRRHGFLPPSRVLLEFCRRVPGLRVENGTIGADQKIDPASVLSHVEKDIAQVLARRRGAMTRTELESICLAKGMNRWSFYWTLSQSQIITKYGTGLYGLIGSAVPE